jgi:hypothetical protein
MALNYCDPKRDTGTSANGDTQPSPDWLVEWYADLARWYHRVTAQHKGDERP